MIDQNLGKRRVASLGLVLGLGWLTACASAQEGPTLASSSGESAYAERYPDALSESRQSVSEAEADALRINGELASYPDALKKTDYKAVSEVVSLADAAGKSRSYAERSEEGAHVRRFASEEKERLAQQTAGSVRYVLSDKGASPDQVDAGGSAAARGQEKAIQKQLEERQRGANPAHRYIEDNEELLGKANVETLTKQADDIAHASHVVHVVLVSEKPRLEQLIGDASEVKKTLARTVEEEQRVAADPQASPRRKKIAQERINAAQAAEGRVDEEKQQAEAALKDLEKRTKELTDAYEKALDELLGKLDQLADQQAEEDPKS